MQIGLIGLGKMGGNMAERLRRDGHAVVGLRPQPESAPRDVDSLEALVAALATPRVVWVMVPSGEPTRATVACARRVCWRPATSSSTAATPATPTTRRTPRCSPSKGIDYVDCGRLRRGLGPAERLRADGRRRRTTSVATVQPIFDALKPPTGGFVHAGPVGAGHFAKMVHNGIEYGIMQAYGEGYELLEAVRAGHRRDR